MASATPVGDEATLVAQLRAGDEAAFEQIVRAYGGRLLSVARRIVGTEEDARDVVQDAFMNAFKSLDRFEGNAKLSTWLHRIVVNAALMRLRTRRRKPEESIESLLPSFLEDGHHVDNHTEWAAQADRLLEDKQRHALVREAIAALPESHRTVLVLRDIEEMSTCQVALELGLTANAVKIRLHRARQALATILRRELAGNAGAQPGIQPASCRTLTAVPTPSPSRSRYNPA